MVISLLHPAPPHKMYHFYQYNSPSPVLQSFSPLFFDAIQHYATFLIECPDLLPGKSFPMTSSHRWEVGMFLAIGSPYCRSAASSWEAVKH